ncbi:MAG TPA: hypothetical protein VJ777_19955 [Mycobacterium sp.]|nr:hypothetical protein [Mycobacterium sp.]
MTTVVAPNVDIEVTRPLRVGLQLANDQWIELTDDTDGDVAGRQRTVRIQAVDLRDACHKSAAVRAESAARGEREVSVLVDIEVMIHEDARSAREALHGLSDSWSAPHRKSLAYVGTVNGLAGLIADIHVLRIADGVTLVPLAAPVIERIVDMVLPQLETMGFDAASASIDLVRQTRSA